MLPPAIEAAALAIHMEVRPGSALQSIGKKSIPDGRVPLESENQLYPQEILL